MHRFPVFFLSVMKGISKMFIIILFSFSFSAFGQDSTIEPFTLPSARFFALGGNHTAMADDFYSLFLNPAAFVGIDETFSAAEITLATYGPVFELIDLFRNSDNLSSDLDISGLIGPGGFAVGLDLAGPLSLGWVGRNLGIGLFNKIRTSAAVSGTNLKPLVSVELLFVGGYSFRIVDKEDHFFDAGFLAKGFFRGILNMESSILQVESLLENPLGRVFGTNLGLGLDLGLRYTFRNNLTAALVCYDVYSPVFISSYSSIADFWDDASSSLVESSYATVKRRLDLGVKYRIQSAFLDRYITGFNIMLDYRDFLDLFSLIPRNPILNIGLGVEITLLNALTFRAGITDALPALGFGLDLSFITLDFAMYGRELGFDPGLQPVYAMGVSLLFRY